MVNFAKAKAGKAPARRREHGGDNEVERDGHGRPLILVDCDRCPGTGKVPSEKVAGRLNKCQRCKGEGKRKLGFTRVTTFIDVLDDKTQLGHWKARMVLIGAARDTAFLDDVLSMDPEDADDKKVLDTRAEAAVKLAGGDEKSDHGTLLHDHSETVDRGERLPDDVEPQDWIDMMAYKEATTPLLRIVHMEQLVVCDQYTTAGTPDRVSTVREGVKLVAPDGYVFGPNELIITDLKTGRVDYGALKIAMQLAIYSRSKLYDKETGERISMGEVNQEWGIIMHLPAGSGECELLWADLTLGWEAVGAAAFVRDLRSRGRRALTRFAPEGSATYLAKAAA